MVLPITLHQSGWFLRKRAWNLSIWNLTFPATEWNPHFIGEVLATWDDLCNPMQDASSNCLLPYTKSREPRVTEAIFLLPGCPPPRNAVYVLGVYICVHVCIYLNSPLIFLLFTSRLLDVSSANVSSLLHHSTPYKNRPLLFKSLKRNALSFFNWERKCVPLWVSWTSARKEDGPLQTQTPLLFTFLSEWWVALPWPCGRADLFYSCLLRV